jgi:hypothetical protein
MKRQDPPLCAERERATSPYSRRLPQPYEGSNVAKKTVLVSDMSGEEIQEGKGATIRISFRDARKGVRELDVTDAEAEAIGGRSVARRGRRPKASQ